MSATPANDYSAAEPEKKRPNWVWQDPSHADLACLLEKLGWRGSPEQLLTYLPDLTGPLTVDVAQDVLARIGYPAKARRSKASAIATCDLPTLAFRKDGSTLVLAENNTPDSFGSPEKSPPLDSQSQPLIWLEIASKVTKAPIKGSWFKSLLSHYNNVFVAVGLLSLVNAVLGLTLPFFTMAVYDFLIPSGSRWGLISLGAGAFIAFAWMVCGNWLRVRMLSTLAANLNYQVGRSVFAKLLATPAEFIMQTTPYQNISRVKGVDRIREFFGGTMAASLFDVPFVVVALAAIALLAGWLVLVPLFGVLLYGLLAIYFNNRLHQVANESAKAGQQLEEHMRQALDGLQDLREAGVHSGWFKRFSNEAIRSARSQFDYRMVTSQQQVAGRVMNMLIALATLMSGVYLVMISQTITAGGLIAAMMLIWRITGPLQVAFISASRISQLRQSVDQVNAIMDTREEQPRETNFSPIAEQKPCFNVDRLVYRYAQDRDAALNGVSLSIAAGQRVALVGNNGSGKSTLLACIAGILHPQAGTIKLDGYDIRQFNKVEYRHRIVYLNYSFNFIEGTVADNLRVASPLANDDRIEAALDAAGIAEYLKNFGHGADTVLMKNGHLMLDRTLAFGVKLARIHLRDPDIYLIDDVYDGSDHPVMEKLRELIESLPSHKTLIYVTHDKAWMLKADIAAILDKGVVAQVADLKSPTIDAANVENTTPGSELDARVPSEGNISG